MRRVLAAILLTGFAALSTYFWNGGSFEPLTGAVNFGAALAGFLVLHYRWKLQQERRINPDQAKDIFS